MTDLSAAQLAWIRNEVGTGPTDEEIQAQFEELASVRDVALTFLRRRRSALLASPLKVTVNGVASIDNAENVKAIERRLGALVQLDDDPTDEPDEDLVGEGAGGPIERVQLYRTRGR